MVAISKIISVLAAPAIITDETRTTKTMKPTITVTMSTFTTLPVKTGFIVTHDQSTTTIFPEPEPTTSTWSVPRIITDHNLAHRTVYPANGCQQWVDQNSIIPAEIQDIPPTDPVKFSSWLSVHESIQSQQAPYKNFITNCPAEIRAADRTAAMLMSQAAKASGSEGTKLAAAASRASEIALSLARHAPSFEFAPTKTPAVSSM